MGKYRFTPQALDDLLEIWTFIAPDNRAAADRIEKAVYDACDLLGKAPLAGRLREDLTTLPLRFWPVPAYPNFLIVYDPLKRPL